MIKAIALDDEPPALKVIKNFCEKVAFIELENTFTKPQEAIKHLRKFPVDLLFLDIQMPSLSGIDFYKSIEQETMVIFTTAYSEYAVEGFNLSAIDYLLKPYTFDRFSQAVNKAHEYYSFSRNTGGTAPQHIYVRADYSLIKINLDDIILIESLDDYLRIHLENNTSIVTRMTLKSMEEKLPSKNFMRVHRSFIVAFDRIESVRNKMIHLAQKQLPIGRSYEQDFFKKFGN